MLRVVEQYASSDTGRQRRANEDSLLARAPLFVVADGMGGAQAGEVASRIAVDAFGDGIADGGEPEGRLAERALAANARIHELSHSNAEQAGMGTTLTAVYVAPQEIAIAHVGDSRAYCLRDRQLTRLTDDHSLVDELMRQGKISPEEAAEHPQRSVITRALGPEPAVEIDTRSYQGRAGDVYLLCSDGLTTMVPEPRLLELLLENPRLRDAGEALIAAANEAGGRDNITVVLFRLEDTALDDPGASPETASHEAAGEQSAQAAATGLSPDAGGSAGAHAPSAADAGPAASEAARAGPAVLESFVPSSASPAPAPSVVRRRYPRAPASHAPQAGRRRTRLRRAGVSAILIAVLGVIAAGAYLALQSVYFIGTNSRGLMTLYEGVPYQLPGGIKLYSVDYVSGVPASSLPAQRRRTLLDHSLRSEAKATSLLRSLELGQLQ